MGGIRVDLSDRVAFVVSFGAAITGNERSVARRFRRRDRNRVRNFHRADDEPAGGETHRSNCASQPTRFRVEIWPSILVVPVPGALMNLAGCYVNSIRWSVSSGTKRNCVKPSACM